MIPSMYPRNTAPDDHHRGLGAALPALSPRTHLVLLGKQPLHRPTRHWWQGTMTVLPLKNGEASHSKKLPELFLAEAEGEPLFAELAGGQPLCRLPAHSRGCNELDALYSMVVWPDSASCWLRTTSASVGRLAVRTAPFKHDAG